MMMAGPQARRRTITEMSAVRKPAQRVRRRLHLGPTYQAVACDLIVVWDTLAVAASGYVSGIACGHLQHPSHFLAATSVADPLPIIGLLLAPLMLYQGRRDPADWSRIVSQTALRLAALLCILLAIRVTEKGWSVELPAWLLLWFVLALATMLVGRGLLVAHISALKRRHVLAERVAIVGVGPLATLLARSLANLPGANVSIVGVFDAHRRGPGIDGTVVDLLEIGKHIHLDRVFVVVPGRFDEDQVATVERVKALDAEIVAFSGSLGEIAARRATVDGGLPLVCLARRPITGWGLVMKALLDRGIGALLLLCAAPVMLMVAIAVRLESPGPVIFRQRRHGLNNAEFEVYKFRTMRWQSAEAASGARQTVRGDPRISRLGRILRKSSLDELPQLLNVVRGEMSLVGPRPHPVTMLTQGLLGSEIEPAYPQRHRVKPGITGFAQINHCRGATETPEQLRRRIEYDLAYIDRWSPLLDLKILALTPWRLVMQHANAF
jgi:exopolysaccharide biosynthesis polyprenyl glycosylphosphotransferase